MLSFRRAILTGALAALTLPAASAIDATLSAQESAPPKAESAITTAYHVGPADVLQLVVWKEPDLSRELEVRFDGMITAPLVGDQQAAGRTTAQIAEGITKALERFIESPKVTVAVAKANSARFYVVGQVTKSGEFPLNGRTTVLQGLALAGGFKEFAKTESVVIIRQDQSVVSVNYKRIADGKDVTQNVALAPGDTVVVP